MAKKAQLGTLNDQQERFCQEYVVDLNGTKAAARAGYSEKGAHVEASRLLRNPKVTARLSELQAARSKRTQITSDMVLLELAKLANSDLRRLFNANGELLPPSEWPDDVALAVSSVEVEELFDGYGQDRTQIGYTKKVKFWDKPKALELLGKHLKLFTDKVEHSASESLEALLTGQRRVKDKKEEG
jgi:phage terminase small subunit